MKTATTSQFRAAIHEAIATTDLQDKVGSWTDAPGNDTSVAKRYVCFDIKPSRAADIALKAELALARRGLTANTRISRKGYIRSTVVIG